MKRSPGLRGFAGLKGFTNLEETPQLAPNVDPPAVASDQHLSFKSRLIRWAIVLFAGLAVLFIPVPAGITIQSWHLFAIFVATIVGSIVRPVPGGAMVLIGVSALAITGTLPVASALAGYADPIVWLVLAAFFISRAMVKTGLGRRIALIFIRTIGHHSLGLAYALISTEVLLGTMIPSTGARAGGVIFPLAKGLSEGYESRPGPTARRLGAFLMVVLYQAGVIVCAMFLTGQASNVLIAKFALQTTGIELTYTRWALAALVPGLISLAVIPQLLYRIFPPEIKHTPAAAEFARAELQLMGRLTRAEKLLLLVFVGVVCLWLGRGPGGAIPFLSPLLPFMPFISNPSYPPSLKHLASP